MAYANAVLSFFFDGPLLTHVLLLGGDVVATIAIGLGILWEAPGQSERRHRIATRLVIWGVVAETLCSISLFAFDESISRGQQETIREQQGKILALEGKLEKEGKARTAMLEQLMPRQISRAQVQVLKDAVKGKTGKIYVFIHCGDEALSFGFEVITALTEVGYSAQSVLANSLNSGRSVCFDKFTGLGAELPESGVVLLASPSAEERALVNALVPGLTKARINVAGETFPPTLKTAFHPAIFVGLKPPPFQQFPDIFLKPGENPRMPTPAWNPK